MHFTWMNLVEPWQPQGVMNGFSPGSSVSSSSRHILQHYPDSRPTPAPALGVSSGTAAPNPPVTPLGSILSPLVNLTGGRWSPTTLSLACGGASLRGFSARYAIFLLWFLISSSSRLSIAAKVSSPCSCEALILFFLLPPPMER